MLGNCFDGGGGWLVEVCMFWGGRHSGFFFSCGLGIWEGVGLINGRELGLCRVVCCVCKRECQGGVECHW